MLSPQALAYDFPYDVDDDWPPSDRAYFLYVHTDHLGGSQLMTEGSERSTHNGLRFIKGEVVQRIEYSPFGKERFVLNPELEEGPQFTGQKQDMEDGLYYYNARYYDPVLGRFIQPDSITLADARNPQTLNGYTYTLNNPLKYIDPSGNSIEGPDGELYRDTDAALRAAENSSLAGEGTAGDQSTEKIGVGYEAPTSDNPFGHSFIQIDSDIYDVNSFNNNPLDVRERHRTLEELKADDEQRGQKIVDISVTPEQKEFLKERLESSEGDEFDYNLVTCNCADYVENHLAEIGINLPREFIDTPRGTLREAREYQRR